jgi:hypothetical protein
VVHFRIWQIIFDDALLLEVVQNKGEAVEQGREQVGRVLRNCDCSAIAG